MIDHQLLKEKLGGSEINKEDVQNLIKEALVRHTTAAMKDKDYFSHTKNSEDK